VKSGESLPIPTIPCPEITAIAFSPDGKTLALGGDTCDLQIRNAHTGTLIKNLSKVQGNEYLSYEGLSFSPDGKILVLSGYRLRILDAQTGETILEDDSGYSDHLTAFSPDGRFLVVSGFGGYTEKEMVQVRDVVSNQIILSIRTRQSDIKHLAFVSDGRTLMIVGESVEFWNLWSGQPLVDVKLTDNPPVGVALTQDGKNLILIDEKGNLQRWSFLPNPQLALGVQPTPTYVSTLTATPDTPKVELAQIAELGKGYGSDVDYSPDGTIAALVENNTLKWYDSKSLHELGSLEVGEAPGGILISPNNKTAVVDGYIGAQIVDLESSYVLGRVSGGNGSSFGYTFSKDSQYMAYTIGDRSTGGPYYSIGLWNVATGSVAFTEYGYFPTLLDNRYHTMSAPAISPNAINASMSGTCTQGKPDSSWRVMVRKSTAWTSVQMVGGLHQAAMTERFVSGILPMENSSGSSQASQMTYGAFVSHPTVSSCKSLFLIGRNIWSIYLPTGSRLSRNPSEPQIPWNINNINRVFQRVPAIFLAKSYSVPMEKFLPPPVRMYCCGMSPVRNF
jgi:WD40 repeat protein